MLILITQREVKGEYRNSDALEQNYRDYFSKFGITTIPVPNNPQLVESYFKLPVAGIILSGGNNLGKSPNRGATEKKLLDIAIQKNLPVLGICRGLQFINDYFDGSLIDIQNHVATTHHLKLIDSRLSKLFGQEKINVNSYHNKGINKKTLSPKLKSFAQTNEEIIEGIYHPDYPIAGIMWHPERENPEKESDKKLIQAFLDQELFWIKEREENNQKKYKLLDGKKLSEEIISNLKNKIEKEKINAKLAIICVGNNFSSEVYIKRKEKVCKEIGIEFELIKFNGDSREEIIRKIKQLNQDKSVTGIVVQLPLPPNLNKNLIINTISKEKDVDGLTKENRQDLEKGKENLACATPKGILRLLEKNNINLENKKIVIVGEGYLVGDPLGKMLKNRNLNFISYDYQTLNLKDKTREADILICATGVPNLINNENAKEGAIIIDAGISRLNGKVVGDINFESVKNKVSWITPVPGGVGPMTVAMLVENIYNTYKDQKDENTKIPEKIKQLIKKEKARLQTHLELIPSENYVSKNVLEALGSVLTNKYSEGYPGKRYYGGNEFIDEIEEIAIMHAKKLFNAEHVNVQPYSGTPANLEVYMALLSPGDKIMGMNLFHGGHLSHGHNVSFSGKNYNFVQYGVDEETNLLDYEKIRELALKERPKMIISGATAYPREIDFKKFHEIAQEVGAISVSDISHIAGLIATGLHHSPFPLMDIVTTTTHKTLRGPRGAMIFCKEKYAKQIDKAVFPGMQGGPHNNVTAAIAVSLREALKPEFKIYSQQIIKNARVLADELIKQGLKLVTNGTDNHLILIDLTNLQCLGKEAEIALDEANITANKNTIPFDKQSPFNPSGIRIGTPQITTRGMKEPEMKEIGRMIAEVLKNYKNKEIKEKIKKQVIELCKKFPLN